MSTSKVSGALAEQLRVAVIDAERKEGEWLNGPDPGRFRFVRSSEEPCLRNRLVTWRHTCPVSYSC